MPPDGGDPAGISDGLESERVEDAQPGPKAETVSSGDGLDDGEVVSTEPDQSRVGTEDGVSDDDGTEGSAALDDGASAEISDGLESERIEDAQPGAKAETESSGDGLDGGEGVSAEPDQSASSGSEGIAPDDAGTDGGMLPAGSASAEISDGLESERVEDAQPDAKAERNRAAMGWMAAKASVRNRICRVSELKMAYPMMMELRAVRPLTMVPPPQIQTVRKPTLPMVSS